MDNMICGRPSVRLSNGLVIVNHSSPHVFTFEDGSVLEACSPEMSRRLTLGSNDTEQEYHNPLTLGKHILVRKNFELTEAIVSDFEGLSMAYYRGLFDICLVALPLLKTIQEDYLKVHPWLLEEDAIIMAYIRCIYVEDRVSKLISITKFTY